MKRQSLAYFGVAVLAGWLALPLAGEELDNAGFKDARNAANAGGAESADQAGFEALHYLAEVSLSTHSNTSFNSRAGLGALHVFPETITNLRALSSFAGVRDGEIQLTWTAPLSSKSTGTVDAYILKRSLSEINSQTDFQNATEITQGIAPQAPGNTETFLAGSLTPRTTYHIRLESLDQAAAASFMSNASSAPAAAVPPGAVTNLSALTGSSPATIDLTWTAPGDDEYQGSIVGGLYRIDYSTEIDHTFDVRTTWQVELSTGVAPGENQAYTLTNLLEGNTYYIRIWTRDELSDNWSGVSNAATAQAQLTILGVELSTDAFSTGTLNMGDVVLLTTSAVASHIGNVAQTYQVRATTITSGSPWRIGLTQDSDQFVLWQVFNSTGPGAGSFQDNDRLTDTFQPASAAAFTIDGAGGDQTGEAVPVGEDRTIWFKLGMPSLTSTDVQQNIRFVINATQAP